MASVNRVVLKNVPKELSRDKLYAYFQKSVSGGGDEVLKSVACPVPSSAGNAAVIEYTQEAAAEKVLLTEHAIPKMPNQAKFRLTKFETDIFEFAEVHVNKSKLEQALMQSGMEEIIADAGAVLKDKDGKWILKGDWYKILCIGKQLRQLSLQLPVDEDQLSVRPTPQAEENREQDPLPDGTSEAAIRSANTEHQAGALLSSENACLDPNRIDQVMQMNKTNIAQQDEGEDSSSYGSAQDHLSDELEDKTTTERQSPANLEEETRSNVEASPTIDETEPAVVHNPRRSSPLDEGFIHFMELNRKNEMEALRLRYKMDFENVGEEVVARFEVDGDRGVSELMELYTCISQDVKQRSLTVDINVPPETAAEAFSKCQEEHKATVLSWFDDETVLFIGSTEYDCNEAMETFRSALGVKSRRPHSIPGCRFSYTFPRSNVVLAICQGDIAAQEVDAIVNAANSKLHNGAGVTGAIFEAGGKPFAERCRKLIRQLGRELGVGEVVHTDACGALRCNHVVHVTGPRWVMLGHKNREEECQQIMGNLCIDMISYADNVLKSKSVSIPAIGTGIYGIPLNIFCEAMLNGISALHEGLSCLQEIRIVNYDEYEARRIAQFFRNAVGNMRIESRV